MRRLLLPLLLVTACSRGAEADLPSITEARSLAAEWALVNEQANEGHLTGTYVRSMRQAVRDELRSAAKSLTQPQSAYGHEITVLLQQPDTAVPEQLRLHAARLKQIEQDLESA